MCAGLTTRRDCRFRFNPTVPVEAWRTIVPTPNTADGMESYTAV